MSALSVILHCDLDCFYAQVERERLKLPADTPLAVLQWNSALAVSYPARKFGIKRGSTAEEIRQLAGDAVTIVSVNTISTTTATTTDTNSNSNTTSAAATVTPVQEAEQQQPKHNRERNDNGASSSTAATGAAPSADPATDKVTLARYREASARVFTAISDALRNADPTTTVERASIDEAYIDVTSEVTRRLSLIHTTSDDEPPSNVTTTDPCEDTDTHVVNGCKLNPSLSIIDARLATGATIAKEIRQRVHAACNYTMSAGISINKLLSKFASAANKPNAQTIIPPIAIPTLLHSVPLSRLRGLGGKLGRAVEALGVSTAGEARSLSLQTLTRELGSERAAKFVYDCVRGVDAAPVRRREVNVSLLAAKSFRAEGSLQGVEHKWMPLLSQELAERLSEDMQLNNRDARTLTVSFRAVGVEKGMSSSGTSTVEGGSIPWVTASRSTGMPAMGVTGGVKGRGVAIGRAALSVLRGVFEREERFKLPISFVGLTACNFMERAREGERISRFFGKGGENNGGSVGTTYEMRLQERRDRELALRLHREESLGGVRKAGGGGGGVGKGKLKGNSKVKQKGRGKGSGLDGVATVDSFFKRKER